MIGNSVLRIEITSHHSYNDYQEKYTLAYESLELPSTDEEITEACKNIGIDIHGPHAHDVYITEYEWIGEFSGMDYRQTIDEYKSIQQLNDLAKQLEKHEDEAPKILAMSELSLPIATILDNLNTVILYPNMSLEDVAEELVKNGTLGHVTDKLACYIDFKAMASDLEIDGYKETAQGVLYNLFS